MKSNIEIAEEYSEMVHRTLNDGGRWLSSNLPILSSGERKSVLKIYRKRFSTVEYDPESGACICTK